VLGGFADGGTDLLELEEPDDDFVDFESVESAVSLPLELPCVLGARSFGGWVAKVRLPRTRGRTWAYWHLVTGFVVQIPGAL
jgi:hypothetical protein